MKIVPITQPKNIIKNWDIYICQHELFNFAQLCRDPEESLFSEAEDVFPTYLSEDSQKLLMAYGERYNLPLKGCILYAHGTDQEEWLYHDEDLGKYMTVSSFIEKYDGKYAVIVLCVCNVALTSPQTNASCIIYGDGLIGHKTVHRHTENMYMALPEFQRVTSYTFEYDTKVLQDVLKSN